MHRYPNGTADVPATPCAEGCLYDIFADPTEHTNLKDSMPAMYGMATSTSSLFIISQPGSAHAATPTPTRCLVNATGAATVPRAHACMHALDAD